MSWLVSSVIVGLLAAACTAAGPAPGSPTAPTAGEPPASTGVGQMSPGASSTASAEGIAPIDLAGTDDRAAPARNELDLVHATRDDAGMVALIDAQGRDGAATFAALDSIETELVQAALVELASFVETGIVPTAASDGATGHLASLDGLPGPGRGGAAVLRAAPAVIDISLFAETGFTTSAFLGVTIDIVKRAGESTSGTLPTQQTREQVANGLRQSVDINTTVTVTTGGGKVRVEISMAATDRIFDASTDSFVALYTSASTGSFEVDACPDRQGLARGTYSFTTKHELNDVGAGAASRSAAARSVEAPFTLVNGPDAHLQRIEAQLDLKADARGPGSPGGQGPAGPFDWAASQLVQVVMPAGGATSATGAAATVTGSGGERAGGAMFLSSAMAQLFMGQVGAEAERFWRSGKCIDLVPSDDTRSVDPNEEIDLTVEAKEAFGGESIEQPIVATFSGTKSLSPAGRPIDAPASFHVVAGSEDGDRATTDLKQTSIRGIGTRQVVYTVGSQRLLVEVDATATSGAGGSRYESKLDLAPVALASNGEGNLIGTGSAPWTTLWHPAVPGCPPRTYSGAIELEVTATIDDPDAQQATIRFRYLGGDVIKTEIVMCGRYPAPYVGGHAASILHALVVGGHQVPINGSTDVERPLADGGTTRATITVSRPSGQ